MGLNVRARKLRTVYARLSILSENTCLPGVDPTGCLKVDRDRHWREARLPGCLVPAQARGRAAGD